MYTIRLKLDIKQVICFVDGKKVLFCAENLFVVDETPHKNNLIT